MIDNAVQNEVKFRAFFSQLSHHSSLLHVLVQKTNRAVSLLSGLLDYFDVGHRKNMLEEKNENDSYETYHMNGVDYSLMLQMWSRVLSLEYANTHYMQCRLLLIKGNK